MRRVRCISTTQHTFYDFTCSQPETELWRINLSWPKRMSELTGFPLVFLSKTFPFWSLPTYRIWSLSPFLAWGPVPRVASWIFKPPASSLISFSPLLVFSCFFSFLSFLSFFSAGLTLGSSFPTGTASPLSFFSFLFFSDLEGLSSFSVVSGSRARFPGLGASCS